MGPPTNLELNVKREEHCIQVTPERKYYRYGDTWVKRSLKPSEWQKHGGYMFVPKFSTERILNEGACLAFLAENTEIPIPRLYACFEDDGAAYLITEFVDGTPLSQLPPEQQKHVVAELEQHIATLKELTSGNWGGPTGYVLPPYRIMRKSKGHPWHMRPRDDESLVFCHNDLSASNVLVDPYTLKITAIIDWEYGGFFPPEFDTPFYLRPGPPVALHGEYDDFDELTRIIDSERVYLEDQTHQNTAPSTPMSPYGPPGARGSGHSARGQIGTPRSPAHHQAQFALQPAQGARSHLPPKAVRPPGQQMHQGQGHQRPQPRGPPHVSSRPQSPQVPQNGGMNGNGPYAQ